MTSIEMNEKNTVYQEVPQNESNEQSPAHNNSSKSSYSKMKRLYKDKEKSKWKKAKEIYRIFCFSSKFGIDSSKKYKIIKEKNF
jgi:hypothetical protein